jgi:hypothetical protein
MPLRLRPPALALAAACSTLALAAPQRADACGGFFCDTGPQSMPVDQTGENILFILDGNTVEAHIQIQYDPNTDASKFAWVIPVLALPEFSVGSQILFDNMLNGSVPVYGFQQQQELCGDDPNSPPNDGGFDSTAGATGGDGGGETDGDPGPEVLLKTTAGAFEIVVLQDDNVDSLMQWLGDNGYQQDPKAAPIFEEYLKEGHLFVAFKLTTGADLAEIHPVVLRYTGDESCVPIRLTRIAAAEDMDIRAFFLGDTRTVPINYRHVLVNPLKIDWPNLAANYKEVVSLAVDAGQADGNAFVTEYAGTSSVVAQSGLYDPAWNAKAFVGLEAVEVVDTLTQQGLMACFGEFDGGCQYNHPLLPSLLANYLPVPDGLTADEFYSDLAAHAADIDPMAWNGDEFSADFDERIVAPGKHAVDLLNKYGYLTRMYTTISPDEMQDDPIFRPNPDLEDVLNLRNATRLVRCDGHATWTLPDGREVFVPNNGPWPDFEAELPYEEEVQQASIKGAPMTLVNNTAAINTALERWNSKYDPVGGQLPGEDEDAGGGGGLSSEGGACNCNSERGAGGVVASLGLLGLLALRPARRRRR